MIDTGNYYTLNHLALITGLTDRTLRNYLSVGLLRGEKINGLWHFTPEQVEEFLHNPAVQPSILAKYNAIIYDFLLDNSKQTAESCVILDLPDGERKKTAEFFCYEISNDPTYHDLRFAYNALSGTPRVILKGRAEQVNRLLEKFYRQ